MCVEGVEGELVVEDGKKDTKNYNVDNLEIVKGIFKTQMWEDHQDQTNTKDQNDPNYEAFLDNSREIGMHILDNAHNYMIGNFRSTKWFYYELEEIRERIAQMERIKDEPGLGY